MPYKTLPIWHICAYILGNNMSQVHMFREFVFTLYQAEMCKISTGSLTWAHGYQTLTTFTFPAYNLLLST